jgi:hypothetical protein
MNARYLFVAWAFVIAMVSGSALAQGDPAPIYGESFRHTATRITEENFAAKLSSENPTYRERIKDAHGTDRYELTVAPQGPEGDSKITSWRVVLRDLRHNIYDNILVTQQEPSPDAKNNLWWLNPSSFASVPVRAKRIIKVDGFFVTMQVKSFHFTPLESPYLDSMEVEFGFANSDPRMASP